MPCVLASRNTRERVEKAMCVEVQKSSVGVRHKENVVRDQVSKPLERKLEGVVVVVAEAGLRSMLLLLLLLWPREVQCVRTRLRSAEVSTSPTGYQTWWTGSPLLSQRARQRLLAS